ncbi:MAG: TolC family protein [Vulcanimicrobiaceae bacterium]
MRRAIGFILALSLLPVCAGAQERPAVTSYAALSLQAAENEALLRSPDVASAQARVHENQALLAAARSGAAPVLTANYAQAPQGGNTNNTITQRLTTVGGLVILGDYLALSPLVRQADATLRVAQNGLLASQRVERVKVIGLYFAALKTRAMQALREAAMRSAHADRDAAQKRYTAGDAPRLDVVRADLAVTRAESDLASARVDNTNAIEALSVETGAPVQAFEKTGPALLAPDPRAVDPHVAVTLALNQRADIASAREAVRAEESAVAVAGQGVLPALTLSAGYTTGVDTGVQVHGPSAIVSLALPVSHAARYRQEAEAARLAQANDNLVSIERQITLDVGSAARNYAASVNAAQAATRAKEEAQTELHAVETGYRNGATSSLDVADARRTYTQSALDELNAIYAQAQARATLDELIGP